MPERYASPARLPQVRFGADSGAKLGRGAWFGAGHARALLALREAQSLGGFRLSGSLPIPEFRLFSSEPHG
jgi:hypothetical protein